MAPRCGGLHRPVRRRVRPWHLSPSTLLLLCAQPPPHRQPLQAAAWLDHHASCSLPSPAAQCVARPACAGASCPWSQLHLNAAASTPAQRPRTCGKPQRVQYTVPATVLQLSCGAAGAPHSGKVQRRPGAPHTAPALSIALAVANHVLLPSAEMQ